MTLKQQLEKFDAQADTYAKATKEPWECESYAEWVASLPEEEQPYENE